MKGVTLLSICLVRLVKSTPIGTPDRRQISSNPDPSPGDENKNNTCNVPLAVIVTISSLLALALGVVLYYQIRRWKRNKRERRAEGIHATSLLSLTAEDLAGTGSSSNRNRNRTGIGHRTTAATTTTTTVASARRGRRSRGRALRRTESGRSVKTLPEYSKEAGDEELVLVRRRSGSMSDEYEDDIPEGQEDGQEMINTAVPITIRPASTRSLSLSRSRSRSQSPTGDLSEGIPLTTRSAPLLGSSGQSMETLQNQGWGEAPTYLEAMSSHNPDTPLPALVPSPRPSALQRTASGFKDLITKKNAPGSFRPAQPQRQRDRGPSTSSSLLHPTTSRFSTASTSTEYPSPWASSHSLLISPPVPNSAMRASFDGSDIPRGGLNPAQMKFLSSKEAVELVGVKLEDVPAHKRRRSAQGSSSGTRRGLVLGTDDAPPPSWEQLDGERRQSEAFDRRNLATPVQLAVVTPEPGDTTTTPLTTLGADEADAKLGTATAEADRTAGTGTGLVDGEVDAEAEAEVPPLRVGELAGDDTRGK